jgi:hypothetical protein
VQEVLADSKKLVTVLICAPPSCSASVRRSRAATARMRAARLTRRHAAGNRFSAGQAPVAAAMVRAHSSVSTLAILTVVQPAPAGSFKETYLILTPSERTCRLLKQTCSVAEDLTQPESDQHKVA